MSIFRNTVTFIVWCPASSKNKALIIDIMKNQKLRTSNWKSFLSVLVLGVLILLTSSCDPHNTKWYNDSNEYLGEGMFRHINTDGEKITTTMIYFRDAAGRSNGMTVIKKENNRYGGDYIEEVNMQNGWRHGKSKTTYSDGRVSYCCYNMGQKVPCQESSRKSLSAPSSFQILSDKYPWVINSLNFMGYDDVYVEAYMDTLESILDPFEFGSGSFDAYYEFGLEELEDTPYDSIIVSNLFLSYLEGREILKNNELRLAILDRYRSDGQSTKDIVNVKYSHLIRSWYIDQQMFEDFCDDLDSCMDTYGPLELEDPFFIDSVDARFARSLWGIIEYKEDSTETLKSATTATLRELKHRIHDALIAPTTISIAILVWQYLEQEGDQGDIIKRAVLEALSKKRAWLQIPTVTTELINRNSATSVTLQGFVLEDGGSELTDRGIAFGTVYNPTIYDQTESSGTGTGEFTVELNGLTEGTYYARTYATNSDGTAYGNCISFTGSGTVGVEETRASEQDLKVYPNPSSGITSLSFQMESSKSMVLNITDMKGQLVDHRDLGILPQGENMIQLDLSSLHGGIYHLQLSNNGTTITAGKLLIVH